MSPRATPIGASILTTSEGSFDPKDFLAKVGAGRSISKYRKMEPVFAQGSVAHSVFYIQKGKVKITVASELGKEAVGAILGKDEFFGEGCLAGQKRRLTVEALRIEQRTTQNGKERRAERKLS